MRELLNILVVHSVKELVRYKSFLALVFGLILVDRAIKWLVPVDRSALHLERLRAAGVEGAPYLFLELPGVAWGWLWDWRTLPAILALFLTKELISMWPSSDMRRMHRRERGAFGMFKSLAALRWDQVVWDALALGSLLALVGAWCGAVFLACRAGYLADPSPGWLLALGLGVAPVAPLVLAGFSYSSKLAVLSRGRFDEKMRLYFKLFLDWGILWKSWVFYSLRIALEGAFVAAIPIGLMVTVENWFLRIGLSALSAAPAYSYVKMASFKFFLYLYRPHTLVREEYADYYRELDGPGAAR